VSTGADEPVDVLVVGAGPTGLALAFQLQDFGARFRLVDRQIDPVHESRALAIQPRTLEVLARHGLSQRLVERGNPASRLRLHLGGRDVSFKLFDLGIEDTAYPFLLLLSQAETEAILGEHLSRHGVLAERGVELVDLEPRGSGVACRLRHPDGAEEIVQARYVAGCDGAHSTVRERSGIGFEGYDYPQTFLLADLEVDGLEPDTQHAFVTNTGVLLFFPLGTPATWRLITMLSPRDPVGPVTLGQLQELADRHAGSGLRLHDPVWMTDFKLHNRGAAHYRSGRVFLAGDAAHIHSPAGGQGMNIGIQDAINLGWKLGLVCRGDAAPSLLDTYEMERDPVGRAVLRLTDRAFAVATTTNPALLFIRSEVVPRLAPVLLRFRRLRGIAFRTVSELSIHYRRSPLSVDGPGSRGHGIAAGKRLPDAPILVDGRATTLHMMTTAPTFHLLLCGPLAAWRDVAATDVAGLLPDVVAVHRLSRDHGAGTLHDQQGLALRRLGVRPSEPAQYLVRPDGYIGYRATGTDLTGLRGYLQRWLAARSRTQPESQADD
jgi:2-polyprenyl-6-methoxyphenol hydroxylase-like FAD-dependent oxidoreductase